jgi:hypothetical protein
VLVEVEGFDVVEAAVPVVSVEVEGALAVGVGEEVAPSPVAARESVL